MDLATGPYWAEDGVSLVSTDVPDKDGFQVIKEQRVGKKAVVDAAGASATFKVPSKTSPPGPSDPRLECEPQSSGLELPLGEEGLAEYFAYAIACHR